MDRSPLRDAHSRCGLPVGVGLLGSSIIGGVEWHVLRAKPRRVEQVGGALEQWAVEFILTVFRRAKPIWTGWWTAPLFPYHLSLLPDIPSNEYLRVRSAPGVADIVGCVGVSAPISSGLAQAIRDRLDAENRERGPCAFGAGQSVVITRGPRRGVEAIFANGSLEGAVRADRYRGQAVARSSGHRSYPPGWLRF